MIDSAFTQGPLAEALAGFEIDLFTQMVDALDAILFADGTPPDRADWDTAIRLLSGSGDSLDAVSIQVALPGESADSGAETSCLPSLTEFGIVYSRRLLDNALAAGAAAAVGTETEGATITRLSLSMGDDAINVDGRAEKDSAVITFQGPVRLRLVRGTTRFAADSREVSVDVDLPWWQDLLLFLTGPVGGILTLGLGPLLVGIGFAAFGTSLAEIEFELAGAPRQIRGAISTTLVTGLAQLAAGLAFNTPLGGLQPQSTPDHSLTEDGHIGVFAQVFILQVTAHIVEAVHSRLRDRFVEYTLQGGRRLRSTELARLVIAQAIVTPGSHAVVRGSGDSQRMYMRSNPDNSTENNLDTRFEP